MIRKGQKVGLFWSNNEFSIVMSTSDLKEANRRMVWVDYAKGIAIILVAYRHILIGIERSGIEVLNWLKTANEIVYSFRMPLFFILSGIFIARTIEKYQGSAFVRLKSKTILYPYLVWGVIQITIQLVLSQYTNSQRTLVDYTYLITNPRAIDQLWYLLALFNCSILFFLLHSTLHLHKIVITFLAAALYAVSEYIESLSLIHDIAYYFLFLVVGFLTREFFVKPEYQRYFKSIPVLLSTLPIFFATQWYWLSHQDMNLFLFLPVTLVGCFVIYSLSFILAERNWLGAITIAGKHSLQIYLMHILIVSAIRMIMTRLFHVQVAIPILIVSWVLGIVIPILAYRILKKTPAIVLFEPTFKPKA
jgi:fucose 4-O-acetylase-like acetyltransferase